MSRVTARRARVLTGSALALAATLVAAPAFADDLTPSSPASTSASAGATATSTTPVTPSPGTTAEPTGSPTGDPGPGPTTAPTDGPTTGPTDGPTGPTTGPTAPPTAVPPPAAATAVSRAEAFVLSQLVDGSHVVGPYGPDLGQTSDVALALAATGDQRGMLDGITGYLASGASGYVHGDPSQGEKVGAHYAGPTAKLALVAQATGGDPTWFGGLDLIGELQGLLTTTGAQTGRFSDDSAFGDYSNPLGQGFAVLALERGTSAGAPPSAVGYLVAAQCADGGFPEAFGAKTCTSSPDATGLVLQALLAADADCAADKALAWLRSTQAADGSYGSNAVDPTKPAAPNVNSTAYAALGLTAAGGGSAATSALAYLISVQTADGGLPTQPSASTTSDLFATAQSLSALTGTSLLSVGPDPIAQGRPTCDSAGAPAAPGPSTTGEPTSPAPMTSTPAMPPTQVAPSTTPSTQPVATALPAESEVTPTLLTAPTDDSGQGPVDDSGIAANGAAAGSGATAGGDELPRTGTDVLTPVAAGVALVFVGLTLLFAGRRRGGRHA